MEIKYDFPSRFKKYDYEREYIYDADVSEYIDEIATRHPGKEIELAKYAWKYYRDEDEGVATIAEENGIESEDDITYETADGAYFIKHVFDVADDETVREVLGDDMKDYFMHDAREMFDDEELYEADPYEYNM